MAVDWQTIATLAIGLAASVYLARRWWPAFKNLFGKPAEFGAKAAPACGDPATTPTTTKTGASPCGNGCGQCGREAAPARDHRVHWPERAKH